MNERIHGLYPYRLTPALSETEAFEFCEKIARTHYENFTVGSFLIPRKILPHVFNVYAFCRLSDDLGDEIGDTELSIQLLTEWEEDLSRSSGGQPHHPVFIALKKTIQEFNLPLQPFRDLIKAFKLDQVVMRYESFEDLLYYCRHSANPVGRLFLMLFGFRDDERFELSDATCTALQLANFWQDVAVDLEKGRIYIPLEDLKKFGYSEEKLLQKEYNASFARLMKFEVDRAKDLFMRGLNLVKTIDGTLQLDIELFSRGGLEILKKIESIHYNVLSQRPALSKASKYFIALKSARNFIARSLFS
jgi:squalene synthase HpnC